MRLFVHCGIMGWKGGNAEAQIEVDLEKIKIEHIALYVNDLEIG